jgi:hypothetical protein
MASFATPEDFATQTQLNLSAEATATVQWLLDGATAAIQSYTRQHIFPVDGRQQSFRSRNGVWVVSEKPIRNVSALTVDGDAFTDYDVDESAGIISRTDSSWDHDDAVEVTYDSGYDAIPDDLKIICVDIAKQVFENPAGFPNSEDSSVPLGSSGLVELDGGHRLILDSRYRVTR